MEINLEAIEKLMKLMGDNKIDSLKFGELELSKSKHDMAKTDQLSPNKSTSNDIMDDEELLFWSTSHPALTQEQIEALSANPFVPNKPKRNKKAKDQ